MILGEIIVDIAGQSAQRGVSEASGYTGKAVGHHPQRLTPNEGVLVQK